VFVGVGVNVGVKVKVGIDAIKDAVVVPPPKAH
jgi:hypothetical protein